MRVAAERRVGEALQRHRMDPVGRREVRKRGIKGKRERKEGGEKEGLRERREEIFQPSAAPQDQLTWNAQ